MDQTATIPQLLQDEIIHIEGAREHNLRNLHLRLPRNKLVVITGISGSGKSSLAFDTIYAEGQRRYMESFASYARQFIGDMERPDVDRISGLSPVISIDQKTTSKNPRSTVGTVTEVYDLLRLMYARIGEARSHATGEKMLQFSESEMREHILERFEDRRMVILAPVVRGRKGHYRELLDQLRKQGYLRVRVDGEIKEILPRMRLDRYKVHDVEVVIDRLQINESERNRLTASLRTALEAGKGQILLLDYDTEETLPLSTALMDPKTGLSYEEPSPNSFSFNSPYGACPQCNGLGRVLEVDLAKVIPDDSIPLSQGGIAPAGELRENTMFKQMRKLAGQFGFSLSSPIREIPAEALQLMLYGQSGEPSTVLEGGDADNQRYDIKSRGIFGMVKDSYKLTKSDGVRKWAETFMHQRICPECNGDRLRLESRHFFVAQEPITTLARMDLATLYQWLQELPAKLSDRQKAIATDLLKETSLRISFMLEVGLEYLNLDRPARTLSGGEAQRIRLATQIGSKLSGITYILDEPSIGLHQRDNERLIAALRELTTLDNSVLVVEHDKDIMLAADYVVDLGPGAGEHGGEVVAEGTPDKVLASEGLTGAYLSGRLAIEPAASLRPGNGKHLFLRGATGHNLKSVDLELPLGKLICVTGVSGSGKSSLINETLFPVLRNALHRSKDEPLPYISLDGIEEVDKVIEIDQSPIGRTPRSNPATYVNVFGDIRKLFAGLQEAKIRGFAPGRFSFNVKGGRCEQCQGAGVRVLEMNFLPDVHVHCDRCQGRRYNRETLEVRYKGRNIYEVLDMSVEEATTFFEPVPAVYRKLKVLNEVGLGYIRLGQPSTTLSGGEAQRVKLASELARRDTGQTIYLLDEPTTGLHFEDIRVLLGVINRLVDHGNTVVIIEHNLDVIKVADHIFDLGPEGGVGGGEILIAGTPKEVALSGIGHTSRYLKAELKL